MRAQKETPAPSPPARRRGRGGGSRLAGIVLVSLALLVIAPIAGFVAFVQTLPREPRDETTRTDAIVVLTGGSERLATGIRLLENDMARQLFVSGVPPGVSRKDLLQRLDREDFALRRRIVLGHAAGDTAGNARETAAWMARQGYRSLRLVTSQYHLPRSRAIFAWAMPEVGIVPHPVFSEAVKQEDWWRWPGTTRLFLMEYAKYVAAVVQVWFSPAPEPT